MADRTYRATRTYSATLRNGKSRVSVTEGDYIELDEADADFIERDSPGVLTPADAADSDQPAEPTPTSTHKPGVFKTI